MHSISRRNRSLLALSVLALVFTASACTTTETVEVDRPNFNPPPDSVGGFLGLYTVSTNQTTCGNCHVNNQTEWSSTAHADAYAALATLPAGVAQPFCYGCHTVSQNGNTFAAMGKPGGWNAVPDSVYHNVQCESCHGPGVTHVTNPNSTNIPLASALIPWKDAAGTVVGGPAAQGCSACHTGSHEPFTEQWAASSHATLRATAGGPAETPTSCGAACHRGDGALAKLSGNAPTNYIGKGTAFPITCVVCHDPHANTNSGQLRAPIDSRDATVNLCTSCHVRSAVATPSFTINSRGAHASQGAVYFGEAAGWVPPGFVFDPTNPVQTSHVTNNARLCAGCHVAKFTTTDLTTGEDFTSVGHLFSPNPCKDPVTGLPVGANEPGGDCAYNATARFWTGCVNSGCHADAGAAAALFNSTRLEVQVLLDVLWTDSNKDKVLETTDGGLLPQVLALNPSTTVPATDSAFFCCTGTTKDNNLSVAEGALFNARMLAEELYSHNDGSKGVHNPALYKGLIAGSVQAVKARYGLTSVLSPSQEAIIQKALSAPGVRYTPPAALRQTAGR
jgi:predicted CXXCH cytochrome family protein